MCKDLEKLNIGKPIICAMFGLTLFVVLVGFILNKNGCINKTPIPKPMVMK